MLLVGVFIKEEAMNLAELLGIKHVVAALVDFLCFLAALFHLFDFACTEEQLFTHNRQVHGVRRYSDLVRGRFYVTYAFVLAVKYIQFTSFTITRSEEHSISQNC